MRHKRKKMKARRNRKLRIAFSGLLFISAVSWAQDQGVRGQASGGPTNPPANPRNEQIRLHEQLARIHQQAADCLRSGATLEECNQQLRRECPVGEVEQCQTMSMPEHQRHRRTHEMPKSGGGTQPQPSPSASAQPDGMAPVESFP